MKTYYRKYQALGNDMVVIDPATFELPLTSENIQLICHRHFGLGADGVCYGPLFAENQLLAMQFFNPDGNKAEKSGNGLRIFARYLWDKRYLREHVFDVAIGDEVINVQLQDDQAHTISIKMGRVTFASELIPVTGPEREIVDEALQIEGRTYLVTTISIGNPHCVIFEHEVSENATQMYGPIIEFSPLFPKHINVQFAEVLDKHTIRIEIWERGAGYTLASGTSSCAAAAAAIRSGRCLSPIEVRMPGGSSHVSIDEHWQVTLTGTVMAVAEGQFAPDFVAQLLSKSSI